MANETDKQAYESITSTFDKAAQALQELANDCIQTENKLGSASKIAQKKFEQLNAFRRMYDDAIKYINYLRQLNHDMYNEFMAIEFDRWCQEMGLPPSKLAEMAGLDPKKYETHDKIYRLAEELKKKTGTPDFLERQMRFEDFLKSMRGGSPSDI
jgi:hypothetical protein